jgi:DegV family protein with EDD domain
LEYLVKGGRLSKARGFFGAMLGIRPILGLHEGAIVPLDTVRGARALQPRMLELLGRSVDPKQPVFAAVLHGAAPAAADRLRKLLAERFRCAEVLVGEMGPVVGTHVGPGAVGLAVLQPRSDELQLLAP